MFNTKGVNKIELRWKATKRITDEENTSKIVYNKTKDSSILLKDFINEERLKGAEIELDYIIDGVDLASHLNSNHFKSCYISTNIKNSLAFIFNYKKLEQMDVNYEKINLKRHLGQQITFEDCYSVVIVRQFLESQEIDEQVYEMMNDENKDTMLYCSACCGDRLCGYLGMQVYQSSSSFIWDIGLGKQPLRFEFSKKNYLSELEEYIELINTELKLRGLEPVDETSLGVPLQNYYEGVLLIKTKYLNKGSVFTLKILENIFQSENIENIDMGIYLAIENGIDLTSIKNKIDLDYNNLSKKEKSDIGWDRIYETSYMMTKNLKFRKESMKASFIYKRRKKFRN